MQYPFISNAKTPRKTTPVSTYRVQVNPEFDLWQTAKIVNYLADLGVTHLYSSPLLQASPGSTHGYDVTDHSHTSQALGGKEARTALVESLHLHGLGIIVDIVPNHMGIAPPAANRWWWDVLYRGRESAFAHYFDIDWSRGKIKLPVLDDADDALDYLRIKNDQLCYHDHRFPLAENTRDGTPRQVHDRQHYGLISWRRGNSEINYRRFFAVSTLAGIRVEEPAVFDAVHQALLAWASEGKLDGIRVDHPDGLTDPDEYFIRLVNSAPEAWIIAEKILEPGESLAPWPIAGTTGYDALAEVDQVFVNSSSEAAFTALQFAFTGTDARWEDVAHDCKLNVATHMERAELIRLASIADCPHAEETLAELLACMPVYRSYLPTCGGEYLAAALKEARRRRPELGETIDPLAQRLANPKDELAIRFQQQSGAVMAKGVEDTAYYRYTRFIAANEVGGDPSRMGRSPDEFHAAAIQRLNLYPAGMTTLSTHDTKRSEDVRARLAVLSEMPAQWSHALHKWHTANPIDDAALAHLLWQTVVGTWPIERERLRNYLIKAAREARSHTGWDDPNPKFEAQLDLAIDRIYDDPSLRGEIETFASLITPHGWSNSLAAKLVQLTMPGVPDIYQGTELWDNSLVDPDNRRPVDFAHRAKLLAALDAGDAPEIDASGVIKLFVVSRALRLRRDQRELFSGYRPLAAQGTAAPHLLAFDRGGAITLVTRLPFGLEELGGWGDTAVSLSKGTWRDAISGATHRVANNGTVRVADLFARYPLALLHRS